LFRVALQGAMQRVLAGDAQLRKSRPTKKRRNVILNLSLIKWATISRVHHAKANFICSGFYCITPSKSHYSASPSSFGGRLDKGFAFNAFPPPCQSSKNRQPVSP
jgi:hypothetical protein